MEAPKQVSKEQYAWCPECEGYIFARALTKQTPFFSDELVELECPRGHAVLKGEEAENFAKTNAKLLEREDDGKEKPTDQKENKKEKSLL